MELDVVERAARKELRLLKTRPEELIIIENDTLACVVAIDILKRLFPRLTIPVRKKSAEGVIPLSRDEFVASALTDFFEDRDDSLLEVPQEYFLTTVPYHDLVTYAQKHNLTTKPLLISEKEEEVYNILQPFAEKQPQTLPAMQKSFVWIKHNSEKK